VVEVPAKRGRAQALRLAPFVTAPVTRIALIGETYHDARAVMVEGVSGLLAVHAKHEQPVFSASRNELIWPMPMTIAGKYASSKPPNSLAS
jgi:phage terminase large subunit-like protein